MYELCSINYILIFNTTNLILLFDYISMEHEVFCCIFIEVFNKQGKYKLL
jgi:hypothetical protein